MERAKKTRTEPERLSPKRKKAPIKETQPAQDEDPGEDLHSSRVNSAEGQSQNMKTSPPGHQVYLALAVCLFAEPEEEWDHSRYLWLRC